MSTSSSTPWRSCSSHLLLLVGVERLLGLASSRLAGFAHGLFVVVLAACTIARALDGVHRGGYWLLAALAIAFLFERLLKTWYPMRLFVSLCAIAPLFFVALFVHGAPVAELSKHNAAVAAPQAMKTDTPVIVVIFDEFPTSSLLTRERQVDPARYPNFAALASTTTWYRNATTVHDYTFWAVPAILDGRRPTVEELPSSPTIRRTSSPCSVAAAMRFMPPNRSPGSALPVSARARITRSKNAFAMPAFTSRGR